ncbi:MAG: XdhC family protein [Gammaproteobacteria bacterium]|nr:XdhC family protein [Gammaproteobacteria bacterium]MCY4323142.1 XdhC family protein [Gammaproteobacteria bacterium]
MTTHLRDMDSEVLTTLCGWLSEDQHCWLATVVKTWGSSPRPIGSLLAANASGQIMGSLSGGCVEDDLVEKLTLGSLAKDAPEIHVYGLSSEETEKFGLPCGGHLHVLVEPVVPRDSAERHFTDISTSLTERRWVTRIVNAHSGAMRLEPAEGHSPLAWDESLHTLTHVFGPAWRLFIIGAGMVSRYLAHIALMLGYQVVVCDPRRQLINEFDVAGVTLVCEMPDDAVKLYADDSASAIVAVTHDPRIDDMGLMEALSTQAFYVGAMGSKRTSKGRLRRLQALDVTERNLTRLHAPIGIPIGSKTPAEIAVSILAEITAVRKGAITLNASQSPGNP